MFRRLPAHLLVTISCLLVASIAAAQQRGPMPDPLVREGVTVKLGDHTYAIPDGNGETVLREVAKVSKNTELYIASTHFHAEHTTGYVAFPASAKYINSTGQEAEFAQAGVQQIQAFSRMSPATAEILKDAAWREADITFDRLSPEA